MVERGRGVDQRQRHQRADQQLVRLGGPVGAQVEGEAARPGAEDAEGVETPVAERGEAALCSKGKYTYFCCGSCFLVLWRERSDPDSLGVCCVAITVSECRVASVSAHC